MPTYKYNIDSDSKNTVDVVGLDNIKLGLIQPFKAETDSALELKPLTANLNLGLTQPFKAETDSTLELKPLEIKPLTTTSNLNLDLKPAVVDLCLTTNIGKVPNVCARLPYHHHVGFTLFGTEIWGFTFSGQQDVVVEELDRQPKVVWHEAEPVRSPSRHGPESRDVGGLRIRLGS
jgi:hypothetical protein